MTISKKNMVSVCTFAFVLMLIHISNAKINDGTIQQENYLEKFHAHKIVNKLSKSNINDIEFIETIVKNFGYIDNYKLRKNYWKANLLVTAGKIVQARSLFEKNRENINTSLKIISTYYKKDTLKILEECLSRLSSQKLETYKNTNFETKTKLNKNQKRIRVAYEELKNAEYSFSKNQFRNSINLYRIVKKHAISVLKDLSTKTEQTIIMKKYKIHIVDNRHEVYKKG